jgi:hypothetical protein
MLSQIHLLLTYRCDFECDHCFLYCSPRAKGTFTREQIAEVLEQAERLGTIEWIYFEGGEPFLVYPLMLEGIRMAGAKGFKTGIVTNGNWAVSDEDARIWLEPLCELGVADLSMSNDGFHGSERADAPVKTAIRAARGLGLPINTITVEGATVASDAGEGRCKGAAIIGGDVVFRGRAADRLTRGLPSSPSRAFTECPYEDLETPERVHVDCFGNVQFCQGLSIGSLWKTPLSRLSSGGRPGAPCRGLRIRPRGQRGDRLPSVLSGAARPDRPFPRLCDPAAGIWPELMPLPIRPGSPGGRS